MCTSDPRLISYEKSPGEDMQLITTVSVVSTFPPGFGVHFTDGLNPGPVR